MDHAHRHRDEQCRVGVLPYDVHTVRLPDVQPPAGDHREQLTVVLDGELAVQDLAADVQLRAVHQGHPAVVAQEGQPLALDPGERLAVPLDHHGVPQGEHLLVDVDQDPPLRVLQLEGVPQAHRLAVDEEHLVAVLVLDPVVVTDAEEPVAYEESHAVTASPGTARESGRWADGMITRVPSGTRNAAGSPAPCFSCAGCADELRTSADADSTVQPVGPDRLPG